MMDKEDDPVVSEHDVYVSTQLMPYLHILQLPDNFEELVGPAANTAARFKPVHRLLDLTFPLDTHHPTYSQERGEELALASFAGKIRAHGSEPVRPGSHGERIDSLRLAGSRVPIGEHSRYFVAASVNGKGPDSHHCLCSFVDAIHLTPVESIMNMRPALKYLDDSDAKTKQMARRLASPTGGEPAEEKLKAMQVQYKKRETEEQMAARLSSYAHLQRQQDEESWIDLVHYATGSDEAHAVAERLVATNSIPIEFGAGK